MAKYRMEDGTIIDTNNATQYWDEDTYHDGRNRISRATGSQWNHQMLYRSRKGRYYIEHSSQWQGSHDHAEWVSPQEATRWLLHNNRELPEELDKHREEVSE